ARAHAAGNLKSADVPVAIEEPKDPAHGDAASNVGLTIAKAEGKPPRAIAQIIRDHLEVPPEVKEVSIAGPGFINFRMAPLYWHREIHRAMATGAAYFRLRKFPLRHLAPASVPVSSRAADRVQ